MAAVVALVWEVARQTTAMVAQTPTALVIVLVTSISSIHIRIITVVSRTATTTKRILRGVQLRQAITVLCWI